MKLHLITAGALALGLAIASAAAAQPPGGGGGGGADRAAVQQACMADFQKFCPDARPGPGGGIRDCVVAHGSAFSDPCKQALATMRAHRQQMRQQNGGGGNPPPQQ